VGLFLTANEGAPYLARFWPDVGINECWRKSAGCAWEPPGQEQ
jgi:hypothetical protein